MKYISIIETKPADPKWPRQSTLEVTDAGLCVLGNLPHGYTFKPSNASERDSLCTYLQSLEFEPENIPCKACGDTETELHINGNCGNCGIEPTALNLALTDIARGL